VKLPSREALVAALRRRRTQVWIGVFVFVLVFRAALPEVIRRVAISQADAALQGRIELGDVDLSLLGGGVTLEDLSVHVDERVAEPTGAAPAEPAETAQPAQPPIFRAGLLRVNLRWTALFRKTVALEEITLDDFAVNVDRGKDGALVLPLPVASDEPTPAPEPEAASEPLTWGFAVESLALRRGDLAFRDFAIADPAQEFRLALESVEAANLKLELAPSGGPGRFSLGARLDPGRIQLSGQVHDASPERLAFDLRVELEGLPVGGGRVYVPQFGWNDLQGALDTNLELHFELAGARRVGGTLALRDVSVAVPDLDVPALAWTRLGVEIVGVDLVAQHADVRSVALQGLSLVVDARAPKPLPLIRGILEQMEEQSPQPDESTGPAPAPAAEPPPAAGAPEAAPAPWTWAVSQIGVHDAKLEVRGAPRPLFVGVDVEVAELASAENAQPRIALTLKPSQGEIALGGKASLEPIGFDGELRIADLALPPLVAPVAVPGLELLRGGSLRADLKLAAGPAAAVPGQGVAGAVRVAGSVGLAGLEVGEAKSSDFGVGWKDLAIELREVFLPDVLVPPAEGARPAPIRVALDRFRLVEPRVRVTRLASGIALPRSLGGGGEAKPAEEAPPPPEPAAPASAGPASAGPEVRAEVARLELTRGRIQVEDRGVTPAYRSEIFPLDLRASGVRWPGPVVRKLEFTAKAKPGGTFRLAGNVSPERSKLDLTLDGLPLAPFHPYAAGSGYGVGGGAATLESSVTSQGEHYDATNRLVIRDLEVTGEQGESLFAQQFGVPLSLALGLMTDLEGKIVLDLPVSYDRGNVELGLGKLVRGALAKAILNAITSPLKLLSAVVETDGKVGHVAPEVAFLPGRAEPRPGEEQRLAVLAQLVGKTRGLAAHLRGSAGADDLRWLKEQALRAQLERGGVVGAVRALTDRAERAAALEYLHARAEDREATVPDEHRSWLEERVEAQVVAPDALDSLARARVARVRAVLMDEHGVAADRLVDDPPAVGGDGGTSVVAIGLGAEADVPGAKPPPEVEPPAAASEEEPEAAPADDADAAATE
jgi:hypothetical protein